MSFWNNIPNLPIRFQFERSKRKVETVLELKSDEFPECKTKVIRVAPRVPVFTKEKIFVVHRLGGKWDIERLDSKS